MYQTAFAARSGIFTEGSAVRTAVGATERKCETFFSDGFALYFCVDPLMALSDIPKALHNGVMPLPSNQRLLFMKRLTITLENYDDSKIVRASLLDPNEESITHSVLKRSGVQFEIEEVQLPLFDYRLDYGRSHIDLQLRTKQEVARWIERETFEETAESYLDSGIPVLRLALDQEDAYLEISRQGQ